jgi:branched-subunit amino acid ABC-type transport system permease component
MDTFFAVVSMVVMAAVVAFLIWSLVKSIRDEQRRSGIRKIWANFGLSIVLCTLFFVSWGTHALAQWENFKNEQREHGEAVQVDEYLVDFAEATLENWQSEFLQLFSFVVLAAAFIHRGSAESRDSGDRMEQMLREIKTKLGA